jgi:Flp pilus assembly protein TadG
MRAPMPMPALLKALRSRRPRGERGSFTFAVVFWALIAMMLAGLVVDGGLSITERQRAGDVAEQAARAGANDLDQNALRAGRYVLAGNACTQAKAVIVASGLDASALTVCDTTGTLRLATGQVVPTVTVRIQVKYAPIFIGLVYTGDLTANAAATAHPQPGT